MHPYYSANRKKYDRQLRKLFSYAGSEIGTAFSANADDIIDETAKVFANEMLPAIPFVGGKKNSNDSSNLTMCCIGATLFIVGRRHNVPDEEIGRLLHIAWERSKKKVSPTVSRIILGMLNRKLAHKVLRSFAEKSRRFAEQYPYAWLFEYAGPDDEYSVRIYCIKCGACKFLTEKGLGDIVPYLCNLDFVTAEKFGAPFYRNEIIACGDKCCATLIKRTAPVVTDNFPPHALRGDGLK
ncbi:MAG: L-2-amino-thiazoline-4-carboxylic acid hydrolase [Ruminiclostridium sp.]|nr:L-2-amino-thiazoline-4-carboxylic acid hydrolase [Ruminiclostridium sp.]